MRSCRRDNRNSFFIGLFGIKDFFSNHLRFALFDLPEKTAPVSLVAGGDVGIHLDQEGVGIAVVIRLLDELRMSRFLSLHPDLLSGPGPKGDMGTLKRFFVRLAVHVGEHHDFVVLIVLYNNRDQAVFIEFQFF